MDKPKKITIDEVEYVRSDANVMAEPVDGLELCIVRTYSAGVFMAYVKDRNGKEATLLRSRRIRYWEGAMDLSQLAIDGSSAIDACKITREVPKLYVTEAIEIIPMSELASSQLGGAEVCQS